MNQSRSSGFPTTACVLAAIALLVGSAAWFPIANAGPGPMTHREVLVAFFLILVLAVTAHLLGEPRPRQAFFALLGLAEFDLYFSYAVDYYATSSRFGSAAKSNAWPVAIIGTACVAACWHGRSLRRRTLLRHSTAAL